MKNDVNSLKGTYVQAGNTLVVNKVCNLKSAVILCKSEQQLQETEMFSRILNLADKDF